MSHLFEALSLRSVQFSNRVGVSPMCMYSAAQDGRATDFHLAHLGSRALGGAGLAIVEATAVEPRGRISLADLGLWDDAQIEPLARIARFLEEHGTVAGIQVGHAGRKGGTAAPFHGGKPLSDAEGGFEVIAPSPLAFSDRHRTPKEMGREEMDSVRRAFRDAAVRAREAGFRLLEVHAAHGYLLHSFLSPLSNQRHDEYGGTFANRLRFVLEVVREVRTVWPSDLPLAVRLSCTDWVDGGVTLEDSIETARILAQEGVDLVDCSSGGSSLAQRVPLTPGYQVAFAKEIRDATAIPTAAVGLITSAAQADAIVREGHADVVLLGRELLRHPTWPLEAARELGQVPRIPPQYARAF